MEWILTKNDLPSHNDLPFITYDIHDCFELWEDTDWFYEVTLMEKQTEYTHWKKLNRPPKEILNN